MKLPIQSIIAALLTVSVLLSGCGLVDLAPVATSVLSGSDKLSTALDDGIHALESASADWQVVLQDVLAQATASGQSTIANEISNALTRGIAAGGAEFRCNADFLRIRARQLLIGLRATLLGQPRPAIEPQFCGVVPLAVDRELVPTRISKLEFYGYDFDTTPIQVLLRETAGDIDVSAKLDRPTHYHMTLNLGSNGVQLTPNSQRLVFKWGGQEISTIGVIQPTTPACEEKVLPAIPINDVSFNPGKTRGDADFGGHGPDVWVRVDVNTSPDQVQATIRMRAAETKKDWTTSEGEETVTIYRADPNWRIQSLIGESASEFSYQDDDHSEDRFELGSGGPASRFIIVGDTEGDDAGSDTGVTVKFNPLRLQVVQQGNCVAPSSVRWLVSQDLLGSLTKSRLGTRLTVPPGRPELEAVQPLLESGPSRRVPPNREGRTEPLAPALPTNR